MVLFKKTTTLFVMAASLAMITLYTYMVCMHAYILYRNKPWQTEEFNWVQTEVNLGFFAIWTEYDRVRIFPFISNQSQFWFNLNSFVFYSKNFHFLNFSMKVFLNFNMKVFLNFCLMTDRSSSDWFSFKNLLF